MKLKSFQVWNYKSIIDSGECRLSDIDNILVLAGQNESGKSAILQALYDYEREELLEDCERSLGGEDIEYPRIRCTYAINDADDFAGNFSDEMQIPENITKLLKSLKEISITRKFSSLSESKLTLNDELLQQLNTLNEKNNPSDEEVTKPEDEVELSEPAEDEAEPSEPVLETAKAEIDIDELVKNIWEQTPIIIFFDDFCDLLPDKILVSALISEDKEAKGYNAVKNVEKILDTDFTKYDRLPDSARASQQEKHNSTLTADFNERWKQEIFKESKYDIVIRHNEGGAAGQSRINFFIKTKTTEYLTPQQRSQGLRWFLSFYLQLTAESKAADKLIILFDEPGLYLHSKAQKDIKSFFEGLAEKDQIVYSTHSPYLIDADKLNRLRLVINSEDEGTTIEKITTKKIGDQKDALKPIIDAIGLEVAHDFSCADKKNVILEGISDYYYFISMKKLFGIQDDFAFLPSMGASNVHLLMELCMGWGLKWLIIFDEDHASKIAFTKIKKGFYNDNDDEAKKAIYQIEGVEGIEEIFALEDLQLVESDLKNEKDIKHSQLVKEYGGKELFARMFSEKVNEGKITLDKLSKKATGKFETIFKSIKDGFGN